jgi:hypothetical protein
VAQEEIPDVALYPEPPAISVPDAYDHALSVSSERPLYDDAAGDISLREHTNAVSVNSKGKRKPGIFSSLFRQLYKGSTRK